MVVRIFALMLASLTCAFVAFSAVVLAQSAVDPQALIGEWNGRWTIGAAGGGVGGRGGTQGPYKLVITKVEGDRVFATLDTQGFSGKITATLAGNTLSFGNDRLQTQLTVDGNQMRGTRSGGVAPARDIQ